MAAGVATRKHEQRSDKGASATELQDELSFLEQALGQTPAAAEGLAARPSLIDRFLSELDPVKALALVFSRKTIQDHARLARRIQAEVMRIDEAITRQVNAILHHPRFQQLEASWRGLRYLFEQVPPGIPVKLKVLNVSWKELTWDIERAIEFDDSQLFHKIYGEQFDMPGGEPFGLLIGDYELRLSPSDDHPYDDVSTLRGISQVAAAAFAPFVAGVHPSFFGLQDFSELERPINLPRVLEHPRYLTWRALQQEEDSRFVGLAMPRVLRRAPYADDGTHGKTFCFRESLAPATAAGDAGSRRRNFLWGNAAYAFAAVVVRSFSESFWFGGIRGVQPGLATGGLVTGLPSISTQTDRPGLVRKSPMDVVVTDAQEKLLADLGFIPLCHCKDTEFAAFYSNQSIQSPKVYDRVEASVNAQMSSMLQYILCVSRFSHYLKMLGREMIGSVVDADDMQRHLHNWVHKYVTDGKTASPEVRAKYPLQSANVEVTERLSEPGHYDCVFRLQPHYELDNLDAAVRVSTWLAPRMK